MDIKKIFFLNLVFLFFVVLNFSWTSGHEGMKPAEGRQGMVSTAHPLATKAGLDILKKGGNAFDAAVAVAAALNVVEPMMSGIGGYGTILVYDAKRRETRFLDSSGKIPAAVNSDVFRKPTPNYLENRRGPKAVSTPGNVNAWEAMSRTYGRLNWSDLFQSAIRLAEEGFILDERTARMISQAFENFPDQAKSYYGKDGQPLAEGDKLIQKDLGNSLHLIAEEGARAFYGGKLGKAIEAEMRRSGGFLSLDDLTNDKAEWWEPVHVRYRDCEVFTASPPSTAFPSLVRLGMMSWFDVRAMGHNSLETLHRFIEVTKHAFWCRLRYAGDPEINPPPLAQLLSESYWKNQVSKIDLKKAKQFAYPGLETEEQHTTHFVVADRWGNIVSATQTLGNAFGSRIIPRGLVSGSIIPWPTVPLSPKETRWMPTRAEGSSPEIVRRSSFVRVGPGLPWGRQADTPSGRQCRRW